MPSSCYVAPWPGPPPPEWSSLLQSASRHRHPACPSQAAAVSARHLQGQGGRIFQQLSERELLGTWWKGYQGEALPWRLASLWQPFTRLQKVGSWKWARRRPPQASGPRRASSPDLLSAGGVGADERAVGPVLPLDAEARESPAGAAHDRGSDRELQFYRLYKTIRRE